MFNTRMFSTRRLNVIAAATLTGLVGTVGIVAASDGDAPAPIESTSTAATSTSGSAQADPTPPLPTTTDSASTSPADGPTSPPPTDSAPPTPTTPDDDQPSADDSSSAIGSDTTSIDTTSIDVDAARLGSGAAAQPAANEPAPEPTAAPAPNEPADEIDEPAAPDAPGVIDGPEMVDAPPVTPTQQGDTVELITFDKPLPEPTVPGPVDLLAEAEPDDPTPPILGPAVFQAPQPAPSIGNISSGLTGCELDCVVSAQLNSNGFNTTVGLDIETTVPANFQVKVTEVGSDKGSLFNNNGFDTEWTASIKPLQPDTDYDLELTVIDEDGHSKYFEHSFTTVDVIDGISGNAMGCELHCITAGTVDYTDSFDTVKLHVETNSPATLTAWVSTSEPGSINGNPLMPAEALVYTSNVFGNSWTFDVDALQADTTYHVVVRAEDNHGVDYQVGTFHTHNEPPAMVRIAFEQIDVLYDGDSGAMNRGELSFGWGFNGEGIGFRSEEKMHAGTKIDLSGNNYGWFEVDRDGGWLPNIALEGNERDWDGKSEFCAAGSGINSEPTYNENCDTKTNVASTGLGLTVDQVEAMPLCAAFGVVGDEANHHCTVIGTPDAGDDYARFNVLVSFDVM